MTTAATRSNSLDRSQWRLVAGWCVGWRKTDPLTRPTHTDAQAVPGASAPLGNVKLTVSIIPLPAEVAR